MNERCTLNDRVVELTMKHGTYREAAKAVGIDHSYLFRLGTSEVAEPSTETLEKLGLVRHVYYTRAVNYRR